MFITVRAKKKKILINTQHKHTSIHTISFQTLSIFFHTMNSFEIFFADSSSDDENEVSTEFLMFLQDC
jgi:hypothetical protein